MYCDCEVGYSLDGYDHAGGKVVLAKKLHSYRGPQLCLYG